MINFNDPIFRNNDYGNNHHSSNSILYFFSIVILILCVIASFTISQNIQKQQYKNKKKEIIKTINQKNQNKYERKNSNTK